MSTKSPDQLIADYMEAYRAADPNSAMKPQIEYWRGWFRFLRPHSKAHFRRNQLESMTTALRERAK